MNGKLNKITIKEGTIIKGKELKGYTLCKILSEDLCMRGFQYKMGMNVDVNPLAVRGSCKAGLYFCLIKDICDYLDYGTNLAIVKVPDDEKVYVDKDKFRTHRLEIQKIMPLGEVTAWEYMHKRGLKIMHNCDYAVIKAAVTGSLEVIRYLHENGADITADNNSAFLQASCNDHLEVVKYLHGNGADITECNNEAVCQASANGVVVKLFCNTCG